MDDLIPFAALAMSVLSAVSLYAGSAHCRWPALRRWRSTGTWVGLAMAGLSLWWWMEALGGGAGLCAMLGTWMLAMVTLPCLAVFAPTAAERDS